MTDIPIAHYKYRVLVDEDSHYMEEGERYLAGEYDSCDRAIAECKHIVDSFLREAYKPPMTAEELMGLYTSFGEDPFVASADVDCSFSSWAYAGQRCTELCAHTDEK